MKWARFILVKIIICWIVVFRFVFGQIDIRWAYSIPIHPDQDVKSCVFSADGSVWIYLSNRCDFANRTLLSLNAEFKSVLMFDKKYNSDCLEIKFSANEAYLGFNYGSLICLWRYNGFLGNQGQGFFEFSIDNAKILHFDVSDVLHKLACLDSLNKITLWDILTGQKNTINLDSQLRVTSIKFTKGSFLAVESVDAKKNGRIDLYELKRFSIVESMVLPVNPPSMFNLPSKAPTTFWGISSNEIDCNVINYDLGVGVFRTVVYLNNQKTPVVGVNHKMCTISPPHLTPNQNVFLFSGTVNPTWHPLDDVCQIGESIYSSTTSNKSTPWCCESKEYDIVIAWNFSINKEFFFYIDPELHLISFCFTRDGHLLIFLLNRSCNVLSMLFINVDFRCSIPGFILKPVSGGEVKLYPLQLDKESQKS